MVAGIEVYSPNAAARFYGAVYQTYDLLSQVARIATRRAAASPDLRGLRSVGVIGFRNYLDFFVPSATRVLIVRVLHAARDTDTMMDPAI
jgi:toxin ParE1/3/4